MKVLLLNPPYREGIIRDLYCSHTTKANYCWPPIDLLALSGVLGKDFDVSVLDCVIDRLSAGEASVEVKKVNPDVIISLTSAISESDDVKFLKELKNCLGCKVFVVGDIAYFNPKSFLEMNLGVDGIIFDFTQDEIVRFLKGDVSNLKNIAYRSDGRIKIMHKPVGGEFKYPPPLHKRFSIGRYSLPYARHKKLTAILTNYGCPYKCSFCPAGRLNFRFRDVDNVIEELKEIVRLGIREVVIKDYTFTLNKERVIKICKAMIDNNLGLPWSCDGRVDNVDREMLDWMKRAGCYLIFFGVESGDDRILKENNKLFNTNKVKEIFGYCNKAGIETLASFIIGLPGETEETINKTINFAIDIKCDYASFNLLVPRYGSKVREDLGEEKMTGKKLDSSKIAFNISNVPPNRLLELHKAAVRRFYMRPSYLLKRIFKLRTPYQFYNLIKNGYAVFEMALKPRA